MVFNDDDSIVISHHNQHFEVLSNCIPYIITQVTFSVAPPWPIIKNGRVSSIYSSTPMHKQDHYKKMISGQYMPPEG
jgi:hypothetical protein